MTTSFVWRFEKFCGHAPHWSPPCGTAVAVMGENSRFSPDHGTTGASPVGSTFAISTKIHEEPAKAANHDPAQKKTPCGQGGSRAHLVQADPLTLQ